MTSLQSALQGLKLAPAAPAPAVALSGSVSAHPNGFGFILDTEGNSHFVPPFLMKQFIPGDIVSFTEATSERDGKVAVATMTLISRPETFWLGELKLNFHKKLEFVADEAVSVKFRLPNNHGMKEGQVFQVRVAAGTPVGPRVDVSIVANLGPRNDREFDSNYASAKWRLPESWPADVQAEAQALANVTPTLEAGMEDLRHLPFVTIDGESTRDFDDAIFVRTAGDVMEVYVAIADVARYVRPGSALDREAKRRGTSVYFTDRVVPMLPAELSNGLCSLNPGVPRAALVCRMEVNEQGDILNPTFARALIQSAARLTYTEVSAYVNGEGSLPDAAEVNVCAIYALFKLLEPLRDLRGLMEYRNREAKLVKGEDGSYGIGWEVPSIAHQMVEECMLAANRAAAMFVPEGSKSRLFRFHRGVDLDKWADTRVWLAAQGVAAPEAPTLQQLRQLLELHQADARYPLIEWRVRRSLAPAVYDEANSMHFTLGFAAYTHFTSPIRRYSDLIVHRLVLGEIVEAGENVALDCSELARRAQIASRHPMDRLKRRSLWREAQKSFPGQIATLSKRGSKVVVDGWETSAFVPAAELVKIGYAWNADAEQWQKGARVLELGEVIQVTLTKLVDDGPQCELEGFLTVN